MKFYSCFNEMYADNVSTCNHSYFVDNEKILRVRFKELCTREINQLFISVYQALKSPVKIQSLEKMQEDINQYGAKNVVLSTIKKFDIPKLGQALRQLAPLYASFIGLNDSTGRKTDKEGVIRAAKMDLRRFLLEGENAFIKSIKSIEPDPNTDKDSFSVMYHTLMDFNKQVLGKFETMVKTAMERQSAVNPIPQKTVTKPRTLPYDDPKFDIQKRPASEMVDVDDLFLKRKEKIQ